MARTAHILLIMMVISVTAFSQTQSPHGNFRSIGLTAIHYGDDAGLAFEVSSRGFVRNLLHVRLQAGLCWSELYKSRHNHWITYQRMGAVVEADLLNFSRAKFFIQSGPVATFTNSALSTKRVIPAWTDGIGLELLVVQENNVQLSYLVTGGWTNGRIRADIVEGKPAYATGLTVTSGLKMYFR